MKLFTWMELLSPGGVAFPKVFLSFSAFSPVCWHFVGTGFYSGYMVINSKGEKGCESPIFLWVTRWLLISFGSCGVRWVVSSLCQSIWYPPFARLCCSYLISEHWREYMLLEWDMSGLRLRRGRCMGTILDLLLFNTTNEELIVKNSIAQLAMLTVEAFKSSLLFKKSIWINT